MTQDPTPSEEDHALTRRLADVGRLLGIPIIDHVIVARGGFRSLGGDTSVHLADDSA